MESPRMGPNLPYKPAPQSRKTNSRKVAKRAISVYLRTGKRAIRAYLRAVKRTTRVQRARLSFPL